MISCWWWLWCIGDGGGGLSSSSLLFFFLLCFLLTRRIFLRLVWQQEKIKVSVPVITVHNTNPFDYKENR